MLIGIDMLGVQSPEGGRGEAGRYGRQLVEHLIARDRGHRFVLYAHQGLPTTRIPTSRFATRAGLEPTAASESNGLRATTQRLLDRNPDGLDWLILLDPFAGLYNGLPPEAPLNGPRVASVVLDLGAALSEDYRVVPLRRHDAILAVTEPVAIQCRQRLGTASNRVASIDLASDATFRAPGRSDPLTRVSGDDLGRLGISGPFLFARSSGSPGRWGLDALFEAYCRLPFEHRRGHQLVVAGPVDEPSARAYLYDRGCDGGLVAVGDLPEEALLTLYGRCSAFLALGPRPDSGLAILEAMRSGAPVLTGRAPWQVDLVGDAGIAADAADPAAVAAELADLLGDADLGLDLRRRALERSATFTFEPVVEAILPVLEAERPSRVRIRFDRGHSARPRIALFPDLPGRSPGRLDLPALVPAGFREAFNVDLYFEPGFAALADGLPPEFGGFDARVFERNDGLLSYHAVAYRVDDARTLGLRLDRIRKRPGLVLILDGPWLDRIGLEVDPGHDASDFELATATLRDLFLTSSRVAVASARHFEQVAATFPEFADRLIEIPPASAPAPAPPPGPTRSKARARLDFLPGTLVIGQFAAPSDPDGPPLSPSGFRRLTRDFPAALLLEFGGPRVTSGLTFATPELAGDRIIHVEPTSPAELGEILAALDLAILADGAAPVALADLMRAGVPTIAAAESRPDPAVRHVPRPDHSGELARAVLELAGDPEARASLAASALARILGVPDAARAAELGVEQMDRCASELSRTPGRKLRRPAESPRGLSLSPHIHRQASATDGAAHGRGDS